MMVTPGATEVTLLPQGRVLSVSSAVVAMTVTPDHVWLAKADSGVEVRGIATAELVHCFAGAPRPTHIIRIWSLLTVPTQSKDLQVWMGLSNGTIEVYDARSFNVVRQLVKHAGGVYCLAEFGGYVYSGSSDFKIAQWEAGNGRLVRMLHGHTNYVRCLYAEGSAVVSGSDDCTVRVWDAGSGEAQLLGHFHGRAGVSALCRVGVTMWSGDDEGRVIAWKLSTCEALRVLRAHGGRVASMRKIGSRVYSGGSDGVIAVFDAEDGRLVQRIEDHMGARISSLQCAWEFCRCSVWTAMSNKMVHCWHHDEQFPMTQERERFNDMRWYYATIRSQHEVNEQLLREQRELMELVALSQRGEGVAHSVLNMSDETKRSSLLTSWALLEKLREVEKQTQDLFHERSNVQEEVRRQKSVLERLTAMLQQTQEAVKRARGGGETNGQMLHGNRADSSTCVAAATQRATPPVAPQEPSDRPPAPTVPSSHLQSIVASSAAGGTLSTPLPPQATAAPPLPPSVVPAVGNPFAKT